MAHPAITQQIAFWQNRRVFLTGHTGFVGSWLSLWLTRLGAQVTGYALAPHTTPSLYTQLGLEDRITSIIADINDREALATALNTSNPSVVLHLAAQSLVGEAHLNPYACWQTNTLGTVALLDAVKDLTSLASTVLFTTDKVYQNAESGHAFTETDPVGGHGIYDSSKGGTELAVHAFHQSGLLPGGMATIRAGNIIGGGDWNRDRLLPDIARAFHQHQPVILRQPGSIRPWQYVLDVCYATLLLTEKLTKHPASYSGAWNIGPDANACLSASTMAEHCAAIWGQQPAWQQAEGAMRYPEAHTLVLNSDKLRQKLHWQPALSISDAIAWTVAWYKATMETPDTVPAICQQQFDDFMDRVTV
ncbi:MAG: CDP-glucose 4,6-dehydratase [Rickettsiales bacterium]|nr:CDP-glucose 4,6-dehydratase [Rickettsiales bacterium]